MNSIYQQKRDLLGVIVLNDLDLSDVLYVPFSNYTKVTFIFNGEKYFFKSCSSVKNISNEVLAEVLANKFGISCASYDLALYNGLLGTISKNFLSDNDSFYPLSQFIDDSHNNVFDIINELSYRYGDQKTVDNLEQELINILIFDILIANHDRHTDNYGLIENLEGINFCPVFDNELMLDYRSIFYGEYGLNIDNDFQPKNLITKIFQYEDSVYKDKLISNLELINYDNIFDSIKCVEERLHSHINPYIKKELIDKFACNYDMLSRNLTFERQLTKKR